MKFRTVYFLFCILLVLLVSLSGLSAATYTVNNSCSVDDIQGLIDNSDDITGSYFSGS